MRSIAHCQHSTLDQQLDVNPGESSSLDLSISDNMLASVSWTSSLPSWVSEVTVLSLSYHKPLPDGFIAQLVSVGGLVIIMQISPRIPFLSWSSNFLSGASIAQCLAFMHKIFPLHIQYYVAKPLCMHLLRQPNKLLGSNLQNTSIPARPSGLYPLTRLDFCVLVTML